MASKGHRHIVPEGIVNSPNCRSLVVLLVVPVDATGLTRKLSYTSVDNASSLQIGKSKKLCSCIMALQRLSSETVIVSH